MRDKHSLLTPPLFVEAQDLAPRFVVKINLNFSFFLDTCFDFADIQVPSADGRKDDRFVATSPSGQKTPLKSLIASCLDEPVEELCELAKIDQSLKKWNELPFAEENGSASDGESDTDQEQEWTSDRRIVDLSALNTLLRSATLCSASHELYLRIVEKKRSRFVPVLCMEFSI